MAYDAKTQRLISLKKLAGKAQTSNDKDLANEALPSGVTMASSTIFSDAITSSPSDSALYTITGNVEYIRFPASFILGSNTTNGRHGFELKLPSDYESNSSNPKAGTAPFVNDQVINATAGELQIVPTSFSNSYEPKPFFGGTSAKGSGTQIPLLGPRNWYLDSFNGVLFQQDPPGTGDHAENPTFVEAYLYIGNRLSDAIASSGGDAAAQYLVLATTSSLTQERAFNPTTGLTASDGGAGGNYTLQIDNSVVATLTGSQFSGNVGITASLGVLGDLEVAEHIRHIGDNDTFIQFADDAIGFTAGGEQLLTVSEAGTDMVTVGDGGDVDFRVRTENDDNTLYIEGSTDRIGVGTNTPSSIIHVKEASPTLTFQRENNSNASTIDFLGALGNTANSIIHDSSTNDLVFKTFNGSTVEEIMRVGDHYGTSVRQVTFLSGSNMAPPAMQPRSTSDIAFFVSGAIGSVGTSERGTSVFGGDTVISGAIHAPGGISGSLQQLTDGTSYLRQGPGVSIVSSSAGHVTISAAGESRTKSVHFLTTDESANTSISVSPSDFSSANFDMQKIDIFINGQLLHSGSSTQVSAGERDYYIDTANSLRFSFDTKIDDILDVIVYTVS